MKFDEIMTLVLAKWSIPNTFQNNYYYTRTFYVSSNK